ncbi:MAG TPA: hypothetical protein VFW75_17450 [Acetobacteraceae bacterium]|nr:hypothetical protein [Acetobacteraceae bacterium]
MSGDRMEGAGLAVLGAASAGVLGVVAARSLSPSAPGPRSGRKLSEEGWLRSFTPAARSVGPSPARGVGATTRAAKRLNNSSALLALSVLADSSIEHYRGMFFNKGMFLPIIASALTLATSLHGAHDETPRAHRLRHAVATTAAGIGMIGGGFHLYNVGKREGGFSWTNLFYGAPLGAPYALILAGLMGTAAEHVRDSRDGRLKLLDLPAGSTVAAATTGGLIGTVAEAALLHFRGAYHDPFMFVPVTIPPIAAGLIAKAGFEAPPRWPRLTRAWLWLTAAIGFVGAGFHVYGVSRNMGGWRNWSQNVLNGPPIPAPPSFTGLALAGLAALDLLQEERHG